MNIADYLSKDSGAMLVCADGTEISVTLVDGSGGTKVDVVSFTDLPRLVSYFGGCYYENRVYYECPIELVDAVIDSHGGIDESKTSQHQKTIEASGSH